MQKIQPLELRAAKVIGLSAIGFVMVITLFMWGTRAFDRFLDTLSTADFQSMEEFIKTVGSAAIIGLFQIEAAASSVMLIPCVFVVLLLAGYCHSLGTVKVALEMVNAESGKYTAKDIFNVMKKRFAFENRLDNIALGMMIYACIGAVLIGFLRLVFENFLALGSDYSGWLTAMHIVTAIAGFCFIEYLGDSHAVSKILPATLIQEAADRDSLENQLYRQVRIPLTQYASEVAKGNSRVWDYAFYVFGKAAHKHGVYGELVTEEGLGYLHSKLNTNLQEFESKVNALKIADPTLKIDVS